MSFARNFAENLAAELWAFARDRYGRRADDLEEDHVFAFLEHCADGQRVARGRHYTLARTLPQAIALVQDHLTKKKLHCPISEKSIAYAIALRETYAPDPARAEPLLPHDLACLVDACDLSIPGGKRAKALVLLLWATWARPSELLRREYPTDIYADDERGVVIVLRYSKTNTTGRRIEYLPVEHTDDEEMCPVCALFEWTLSLGVPYRGPLFPGKGYVSPRGEPSLQSFAHDLDLLSLRCWGRVRFTPYSFRRGGATTAARAGWAPAAIRAKLRHTSIIQSMTYIEPGELYPLVRALPS